MFSFSMLVNTLKGSMAKPISNEDLINLLIKDIVETLFLENQVGELLYLDKTAASKIMNNKTNVSQKIRGALDKDVTSIEQLEIHLKNAVIPLMIPEKIEDVCQLLSDAIMQYKDVPSTIADMIDDCKNTGNSTRLIAVAVRFSFMIPNKNADMINQVGSDPMKDRPQTITEDKTPLQKMLEYLSQPTDWNSSYSLESDIRYYKFAPEYAIERTYESEEGRAGHEYYLFAQRDSTPHWTDIRLKYHQTVLYHTQGAFLDGGRYFTPCPEWGVVHPSYDERKTVIYKYLIKGSCDEIIHKFYYDIENPEERYAHDRFIDSIIVFPSEEEHLCFEEFAGCRWNEYEKKNLELKIPYIEGNSEQVTRHYEDVFRNVRLLQQIYRDYLLME